MRPRPLRSSVFVDGEEPPEAGTRMLVLCEGGPYISRLVEYPPPFEIEVGANAMYVLDERKYSWGFENVYIFVPQRM
jgi:hypothetical protein